MKRARILVMVLGMLMAFYGTCLAEHWEQLENEEYSLDTDSIQTLQVDYDSLVKAKVKIPSTEGNSTFIKTLFINRDSSKFFVTILEKYSPNGTLLSKYVDDPKKKDLWDDGTNKTWIQKILKRVQ